jgi:hypothetical protein
VNQPIGTSLVTVVSSSTAFADPGKGSRGEERHQSKGDVSFRHRRLDWRKFDHMPCRRKLGTMVDGPHVRSGGQVKASIRTQASVDAAAEQ